MRKILEKGWRRKDLQDRARRRREVPSEQGDECPGCQRKACVNGLVGPGNRRRGLHGRGRKGVLEDFLVLAGTEEFQLAGASDIDQEPIAFAADMAFPEPLPIPLERVVFVTRRQGSVRLQGVDDRMEFLHRFAALLLASRVPFVLGCRLEDERRRRFRWFRSFAPSLCQA
jgi:hypothetical protein